MPLVVVVPSAAPLRRPQPFRSLHPRRSLALTRARCDPSPPAEAQSVKPPNPRRYPKQFPGEAVGVAEEMRFVAMRLRNPKRTTLKGNTRDEGSAEDDESEEEEDDSHEVKEEEEEEDTSEVEEEDNREVVEEDGVVMEGEWMPSIEGFVRYLVDSKLVFDTVERVVAGSTDVACECNFSSPFFSAVLLLCYAVTSVDLSSPKLQCDACIYSFGPGMGFGVVTGHW